jgi:hypothetical protein
MSKQSKIIIDAERSGLASAFDGKSNTVLQSRLNPTVIDMIKRPSTKTSTASTAIDAKESVDIRAVPISLTQSDELANEYVKNLTDRGLIIRNVITQKLHKENDPDVYYECISRLGDTFLIRLPIQNMSENVYFGSADGGKVLTMSEGQLLPVRSVHMSSCASDPVCNKIFSCPDGVKGGCYPSTQGNKVIEVERCVESKNVTMKHSGMPIACPVYEYVEYLGDPVKVTNAVAASVQIIIARAIDNNKAIIEGMTVRSAQFNSIMKALAESVTTSGKELATSQAESLKIAELWIEKGGASDTAEKEKYDALIGRRMSYASVASNIVEMSKSIYSSMDMIHSLKKDAVDKIVRIWAQNKLRLNGTDNTPILPESINALKNTDVESLMVGKMSSLDNAVIMYAKTATFIALYKGMTGVDITPDESNSVREMKHLGELINQTPYAKYLSTAEAMKDAYIVVGVNSLYEMFESASPEASSKALAMKDGTACESGKFCMNIDSNGNVAPTVGGNMGSLGSYTTEAGARNAYASVVEKLIR